MDTIREEFSRCPFLRNEFYVL